MKTLQDFQQEIEKRDGVQFSDDDVSVEAAELYAHYRYIQGKADGRTDKVEFNVDAIYKQGWNEALHWASENAKVQKQFLTSGIYYVDKQSILKGLKP